MVMPSSAVHGSCHSCDTWRYRGQQSAFHSQTGRGQARWVQQSSPLRQQACHGENASVRSQQLCSEYEGYKDALKGLDAHFLRDQARSMPNALSLDFLLWLADRERDADGEEGEQLTALCQQLTAIREGLVPCQPEDAASRQLGALAPQSEAPGQAGLLELGARWRALTARASGSAQAALSLEAARLSELQVVQLDEGVRAARATSAVELMGRKLLQDSDQAAGVAMTPADPAARILEALLAEPDQAARFAMLPEAFTPPDASGAAMQQDSADDEEQLSTSPIQLIQAIDLALKRLDPGADWAQPQQQRVLPGSTSGGSNRDDVIGSLRALRDEVFRQWQEDA